MEWDREHRSYMRVILTQPDGTLPGNLTTKRVAKDLIEAGYAYRDRKTGVIVPTLLGRRAWREGRVL